MPCDCRGGSRDAGQYGGRLGRSARPARRRSGRASISGMVFCCIAYDRCPPLEAGRSTRERSWPRSTQGSPAPFHSNKVARGG
jgi:hypothetical protein